jgi:hypothetical protein
MGTTRPTNMGFGTGMVWWKQMFLFGVWEGYHRIWDDNYDMGLWVYGCIL